MSLSVRRAPHQHTMLCLHGAHTLSLCARPLHLKRPRSASSGLLNERQWEAVVLPQGRPRSALARVGYATAITMESKERKCFRLMFESAIWTVFPTWEDVKDDCWLHLLSKISDGGYQHESYIKVFCCCEKEEAALCRFLIKTPMLTF